MRRSWALVALAMSCGGEKKPDAAPSPPPVSAALGGSVAARVGGVPIDRSLVLAVARARGLSAVEAARVLIEEELVAEAARRAGGDKAAKKELGAVLARALVAKMRRAALDEPWSDKELEEVLEHEWVELDRPETRVVVHALVPKATEGGADIAKKLREDLVDATGDTPQASAKAFTDRAKAFPMPAGHAIVVEDLPPFTVDGRIAVPREPRTMDKTFSAAAFAVPALGTSEVIETPFGWHVLRVIEVRPPKRATREEKIAKLEPHLLARRVKGEHEALVSSLREKAPVTLTATDADLVLPR